jgi:MurNAc alpha-1-phosphate uridylyltransferase
MSDRSRVAAVVLAAGEGRRLRPLTEAVPKALCPVGNVPLLDLALRRLGELGFEGAGRVAVNAWYLAPQIVAAVDGRAYVSVESGARPLGTAGGLAHLRDWLDGRGVLAVNADAYLAGGDLGALLDGWDGHGTRLLGVPAAPGQAGEFGHHYFAGASLLPWHRVVRLAPMDEPTSLVLDVWRPAERAGELRVVEYAGTYLDTGTPTSYLAANLHAAASAAGAGMVAGTPVPGPCASLIAPDALVTGAVTCSVIGSGAHVAGRTTRCVVWPSSTVAAHEHLSDAIRYGRSGTVSMS